MPGSSFATAGVGGAVVAGAVVAAGVGAAELELVDGPDAVSAAPDEQPLTSSSAAPTAVSPVCLIRTSSPVASRPVR
jgi:hypothetical protein